MHYIVIRESRTEDLSAVAEVVRKAYISNVFNSWMNALLDEKTFQAMISLAAVMFILFGAPIYVCFCAIPIVLVMIYIFIYGSFLMKAAQITYEKKALKCWVAEAYEPFFFSQNPSSCYYKIIPEEKIQGEDIPVEKLQRRVIGTVAVMKHSILEDFGWLFRLAVDKKYRRKGIGLQLVQTVKLWCRNNKINTLELAMSECQEGARGLFALAGFDIKQLYHKKISGVITLQMFQLRCEVRSTF